ncbi:MAG: (d)CMP kinase [Flavobacteriaceae bacterium]
MKKSFIIAIDGASSTGKSTLAKALASSLNMVYVDSGAMYRGVTLYAQQQQWLTEAGLDKEKLISHLDDIHLTFTNNKLFLNGADVSSEIRSMAVSNAVSIVASISEIRAFLVAQQRIIGATQAVVMDGRDIGTVVFPDADLKLFLFADDQVRAQRRFNEIKKQDTEVTLNQIHQNIKQRDYLDSTRADSPLIQAPDAIALDATQFTAESMLNHVLELISKRFS